MKMLETLMAGAEYVAAAKRFGVYAFVLQWIAAYRRGERPAWPGAPVRASAPGPSHGNGHFYMDQPASRQQLPMPQPTVGRSGPTMTIREDPRYIAQQAQQAPYAIPNPLSNALPTHHIPAMNEPRKVVKENTALATVPPPKRALDTLHESYRLLGIDDSKPLSHEVLRSAYKKSAARAHPDRGGSAAAFDGVTRAFLYLEEVLNKLIPRGADGGGDDARFTAAVTKEAALKARDIPLTKYDAEQAAHYGGGGGANSQPRLEEPKIALNPKKLNMDVFNQLFEENRLPDPDRDDGYGDWLKSNGEDRRLQNESVLRSKFNADIFNKTFMSEGTSRGDVGGSEIARYQAPDAIIHSQGTELGGARPKHFVSALGAKTGYTDLKYAYGEGSTFSQEVADVVADDKRSFDQMKRERESAPVPLSAAEMSVVQGIDRQRAAAEEERRRRLAVQDVAAEDIYSKLQRRLAIQ
jgi:hypothetical protein